MSVIKASVPFVCLFFGEMFFLFVKENSSRDHPTSKVEKKKKTSAESRSLMSDGYMAK